jgi:uncharacterized membrane protein
MNDNPTADELLGAGILGLFCCLVASAGLIGVLIWMFRKPTGTTPPPAVRPPVPMTPMAPVNDFHLSVMALAFDGYFRSQVDAMLTAASSAMDPVGARVELVQRVARALLGVAPQWRSFGYGEKDLVDLTQAQESYGSALADFRARSALPSDGGSLAVLTLVLCTRGRRAGVDRLDTRMQIHDLLNDRLKLDANSLLGAEVIWAPPQGGLSEPTIRERFPEMHSVVQ